MSSGNPMGLSEISHFGSFQRVGGKAGGFINKKFFHPSSLRNQEKLWKAQTADERDQRRQAEMQKRRDEERQVDELKKQMYLSGQGSAGDFLSASADARAAELKTLGSAARAERETAIEEEKRRRASLRRERALADAAADEEDEDSGNEAASSSKAAKGKAKSALAASRYPEDVYIFGHSQVWGSWYNLDTKRWGFACCKISNRETECTGSSTDAADASSRQEQDEPEPEKGSKRRREDPAEVGGLKLPKQHGNAAKSRDDHSKSTKDGPSAPLIDEKLLKAADKRRDEKIREAARKEEAKSSGYLADLLSDPAAGL